MMIKLVNQKVYYKNGGFVEAVDNCRENARDLTMAYRILDAHNKSGKKEELKIKFDAMASHDITYVGIIQTARASGLVDFPVPYVLTNCHNSLCAVGGTINEDDHMFGLSAAKKYGGIFVPAHQSVIHSYMRECFAGCGKMILGSDSHTRYGAIGTLAVGEGGPELVKQLLGRTYDIPRPEVVAVHLIGKPKPGVGPHDVAIALVGATFKSGFVKNRILEFVGEGIKNLSMDFRCGVDVMTTETTCLSSIWETDEKTEEYLKLHNRVGEYRKLSPIDGACYDRLVEIDLSEIEPMIALPFHPSNAYTIREFNENAEDILSYTEETAEKELSVPHGALDLRSKLRDGRLFVDQGVIAGCAGGSYENLCAAADILKGKSVGSGGFGLSVYPASQPTFAELIKSGRASTLVDAGAILRTAFCGPCFGAGDVPSNGGLSIRHTTRNFPNREGSKPGDRQIAAVALMDSRSIAATAANGGMLTAATELDIDYSEPCYHYDDSAYKNRVYNGFGHPNHDLPLKFGPNIADWPEFQPAPDALLIKVASVITDAVTTTDELIPSGETSSYRSNPEKLASFALSRKDPLYVGRAKEIRAFEEKRRAGEYVGEIFDEIPKILGIDSEKTMLGTVVCAVKPGDGSAREQAASCQRVLGGVANIANEYATKRYRSNLVNWGMLPFTVDFDISTFKTGDYIYIENLREILRSGADSLNAKLISNGGVSDVKLKLENLTADERDILLAGCLINYYKK